MPPNLVFMQEVNNDYIAAGRIAGPHGTGGWVKVVIYSGLPDRFDDMRVIYMKSGEETVGKILLETAVLGNGVILKFRGVDTREAAKELIGKELLVPAGEKIALPKDTFFIDDLVGLAVFDIEGVYLGKVSDVLVMSGNDVYVVNNDDREILIPAISEFVEKVDVAEGKIVVRLWEEM